MKSKFQEFQNKNRTSMGKKILTILFTALLVLSCGGDKKKSTDSIIAKGDLKEMRAKRTDLVNQAESINKELELIDNAISAKDSDHKLALITTITAKDSTFNHYLELQASVKTKENLVLNSEYGGILQNVYVTEGQKVTKGQILAKIDDGGLSQQLAQMEIQSNLAKTTFERQKNLWDKKIGSEIQFLQAKSNYEAQMKSVSQMKSQLAKTTLRAPFSGNIEEISSERGSVVGPGTPILRIVSLGNMYLEAEVPEKNINSVKKGSTVNVEFPVLNESFDAKISQASNYIQPENRSFTIKIEVPNKSGNIKPNLSARIKINDYTNTKVITVPLSIISENADGEQYLYVAENPTKDGVAIAKKVIVTTGLAQGDVVEILSGIKDGDLVIKEGARSVKEGQKVTIIK